MASDLYNGASLNREGRKKGSTAKGSPPTLPDVGFVRLRQIIGDPTTTPPTPALIPIGASTWWMGCRSGRFPKPDVTKPIALWRVEGIRKLLASPGCDLRNARAAEIA